MFSPKEIHDLEQGMQELKEYFIPLLKSFFDGAMENGFTREESLELTKEYMVALMKPQNS